jgi:AraC family transcriptional regulator
LSENSSNGPDRRKADPDILNVIPQSAGPRVATFRGGVIHSIREPGAQTLLAESHFASVMLAPAPKNRAALGSDRLREYDAPTGALVVQPVNVDARAEWSSTRENVIVVLRPESLLELAAGEFDVGHIGLRPPRLGTVDLEALHIAHRMKAELTHGTGNEFYIDALITMFGIHLLRNHAEIRRPLSSVKGGLSLRAAARVKEFLDVNFTRKLSVAEVAAVAGLSPRHCILAFAKTFGQPPHQYLIERRLSFAEALLSKRDLTIAEIALLSGFSDQSHLTATMSKYRNRTPRQVRLQR